MRFPRPLTGILAATCLAWLALGAETASAAGGAFTIAWSPTSPTASQTVTFTTDISGCGVGNASVPSLYYWVTGPATYNSYYSNTTLINGGDTAQAQVILGPLPAGSYTVYAYGRGTPCFASSYYFTDTATYNLTVASAGPSVPGTLAAVANSDGSVTLNWSASSDGSTPVTGYTVTPTPACGGCTGLAVTGNPALASTTVTGLSLGTRYSFTVAASDLNGTSGSSGVSNAVVPATAPGPVGSITAVAADGYAIISWTAAADNGAAVTSYQVVGSPAGSCVWTSGPLQCTVPGLTDGLSYTFEVSAINSVGTGTAASSAAVTPAAPALVLAPAPGSTSIYTLVGVGLQPGAQVIVSLHSPVAVTLATVTVAAAGTATGTVQIPYSTVPGSHTLIATSTGASGGAVEATLAITVADPVATPSTGSGLLAPAVAGPALALLGTGTLLVAMGLSSVPFGRRRRFQR